MQHRDLAEASNLALRRDFSGAANASRTVLLDYDGHGTAVGSVVGASGGNGFGIVGIAPGSTVVPMRLGSAISLSLLGSSNGFRNEALRYAAEQKIAVVTASWLVPLGAALT